MGRIEARACTLSRRFTARRSPASATYASFPAPGLLGYLNRPSLARLRSDFEQSSDPYV